MIVVSYTTVKAGSKVLKQGTDYTLSYRNNTNAGTATVTAKGKGNHAGTKSTTIKIKIVSPPGKCIGVLNFNNMVPVDDSVLRNVDLNPRKGDSKSDRAYKELMRDQLSWCNDSRELISRKASKLYDIVTSRPDAARRLVSRCCNFVLLERVLDQWQRETANGQ